MLKLVRQCAPWLDWKVAGIATLVAVGVAICLGMPSLSLLVSAAPLLLIAACLVPCLVPLALLRRKSRNMAPASPVTISLVMQQGDDSTACGCGQDTCSTRADSTCERSQPR